MAQPIALNVKAGRVTFLVFGFTGMKAVFKGGTAFFLFEDKPAALSATVYTTQLKV